MRHKIAYRKLNRTSEHRKGTNKEHVKFSN